ncbi:MAG: hypothetical protein JXA54_03485 [Candidatus Heimdallarchaeota archaeon]|nr:hypothetical protein [Candidatus Heimdallarchaeota archaeon]
MDLFFHFEYKRLFGSLAERLYDNDNQYDDTIEQWQYSYTIDNDDVGERTIGDSFLPSFCIPITTSGDEYKIEIRIEKGPVCKEDHSIT